MTADFDEELIGPVNPLRDPQDRRLPRIAGPCSLVIFGVTGDLARKKDAYRVRPGQPGPVAARFRPGRLRPAGLQQPGLRPDRARLGQGARPDAVPGRGLAAAGRGLPVRARRPHRRRGVQAAAGDCGRAGRQPRYGWQPRVLPVHPAGPVPAGRAAAERARPDPGDAGFVAPGGDREAVRARPAERAGTEPRGRVGLPARGGLPDRPLPGQGDRAEHVGAALRQRDVRAGLEQPLRRPRADHHGRGHRHRRPRRVLRRHRRRARRDPEPPAPTARADCDGGAGLLRRVVAAAGEEEGAGGRQAAGTPRPAHRPRPVRHAAGRAAPR